MMNLMLLNKVNKILCKQGLFCQFRRYVQSESYPLPRALFSLNSKRLLNISGQDASVFLQGLITNDIRHFDEGAKCIYAMFLNNKGRVLYDTLVYKWDNTYMLECDENVLSKLQKHLKLYKLKRDVEIVPVEDFKLWAFMPGKDLALTEVSGHDITMYKDPRITDLGYRVLTKLSVKGSDILNLFGPTDVKIEDNEESYKLVRYRLGVSEGSVDITPGTSFPLEANCDYLHGVSFHKGCYIGQELTARVHHTGVVRKRIMPVQFTQDIKHHFNPDESIVSSKDPKITLGKLKSNVGDHGLALLKIKESLETKILNVGKYTAEVVKPSWWPKEAPKEKAHLSKLD